MIDKMLNYEKRIGWYIRRPEYYFELSRVSIIFLKKILNISKNNEKYRVIARKIYEKKAVSTEEAIFKLTGEKITSIKTKFKEEFSHAEEKEKNCPVKMGGLANINLLYHLTENIKGKKIIETGVAYGWSSLAILLSLKNRDDSFLISTDKPYPGMNNENYVGCVVPNELKNKWIIIKSPDRRAVPQAIKKLKEIDLCHYDSDKTYEGRSWSYPRLWKALRPGGIFISDDVGDNLAFYDFCKKIKTEPTIVRVKDNFEGILIKNK